MHWDGDSESIFRDSTVLRFNSLFFASRRGISGDSRPAILGIVRFATRDSVSLSPESSGPGVQQVVKESESCFRAKKCFGKMCH